MSLASAPPPGKYEWLIVVPDKPGTLQKRLELLPKHSEALKPMLESSMLKTGDKPADDNDPTTYDLCGSTMVLVAESKQEVQEFLSKDIYATSGVWDVDNALIWAAKIVFRTP
ncbi:hypothetical protein F5Y15DRAFT_410484 [Xylariaceae sp. FL0016]|nr:hypothetical protein F5Y15DRAFT_410484 [Xylariaceae sp. FL0016]